MHKVHASVLITLNLFIEHSGEYWWEQNIFCLFTTSILAKLSIWCFKHSGDIICSLLVNLSRTDESWAGVINRLHYVSYFQPTWPYLYGTPWIILCLKDQEINSKRSWQVVSFLCVQCLTILLFYMSL